MLAVALVSMSSSLVMQRMGLRGRFRHPRAVNDSSLPPKRVAGVLHSFCHEHVFNESFGNWRMLMIPPTPAAACICTAWVVHRMQQFRNPAELAYWWQPGALEAALLFCLMVLSKLAYVSVPNLQLLTPCCLCCCSTTAFHFLVCCSPCTAL